MSNNPWSVKLNKTILVILTLVLFGLASGASAANYSGTSTSDVFDSQLTSSHFGTISWSPDTQPVNTSLVIKVKSCTTVDCSGSDASWDGCEISDIDNGADLSGKGCVVDGRRWFQYQAIFTASDTQAEKPSLDSLTIRFQYPTAPQNLISSAFDTGDRYNALGKLSWTNTGTGGLARFQVRTAGTQAELAAKPWCGPIDGIVGDCDSNTYFTVGDGNEVIDDVNNDKSSGRWMQYKMELASTTGTDYPNIETVNLEYNFNEPPYFENGQTTIVQNSDGTVGVAYNIKDVENSSISNLLFYQPNGLSLHTVIADAQGTADIVLDNPTNFMFASSGSILIDNELISYNGVSGNGTTLVTLAGVTRAENFDGSEAAFPTEGVAHTTIATPVWIKSNQVTGDMGTLAITPTFATKTATWTPDNEPHLNGKYFSDMKMKLVANDGYAFSTNRIRSSAEIPNNLDLELPTINSVTTSATENTYFNFNDPIELTFNISEDLSAVSGTANLSSGGTCLSLILSSPSVVTCTYTVGSTDNTPNGVPLTVESIAGTLTDTKGNVRTNPAVPTGENNIDAKNLVVDNVVPEIIESEVTPKDNTYFNSVTSAASDVSYTLSENVFSGSIIFAGNDGQDKTCVLKGAALEAGPHYNLNLLDTTNSCLTAMDLNNGVIYTMTIYVTDFANNPSAPIVRSNILFDTTPPTLTGVTITSSNVITSIGAKVGDTMTVSFTASEPLHPTNIPVVSIDGKSAAVQNAGDNAYTATYVMQEGDTEGVIPFTINFSDRAENPGAEVTNKTSGTDVTFDKTAPVLQSFSSDSAVSVENDVDTWYPTTATRDVDVHAVFAEPLTAGSITLKLNTTPTQHEMTISTINGNKLSYDYSIITGENIGALQVASISSYSATDWVGNTITDIPVLATIDNFVDKLIRIDTTGPELVEFSAPAGFYKDDHITLTARYNKNVNPDSANYDSYVTVKLNTVDANGLDKNEEITFRTISGETLTYDYPVRTDYNAQSLQITEIVSQRVYDLKTNYLEGSNMNGVNNIHSVLIDTVPPQATIDSVAGNDIEVGPVVSDQLTVDITETNEGTHRYITSTDNISCTTKDYANGTEFTNNFATLFDTEDYNEEYICMQVIDTAGNAIYLTSANPLNIDATNPTGAVTIDGSAGEVQLTFDDTPRDTTGLSFQIMTYTTKDVACDFATAAPWAPVVTTYPLPEGHVKACVQFKDQAGNVSQTYTTTAPETPMSFQLNDISNLVLNPTFRGTFLSWQTPAQPGTGGVDFYQIMRCDAATTDAECTPTEELAKIQAESGENFYVNNNLEDRKYCYRVRFKDNHVPTGNYSAFSARQCFVPGVAPIVSTTQVSIPNDNGDITISDVTRTSARIAFRTEDAAPTADNAALPTMASVTLYTDADLNHQFGAPYTDSTTNYNVNHVIDLTGLEAGVVYYLKITATDSSALDNPTRTGTLRYMTPTNANLKVSTLGKLSAITMLFNDGDKAGDPKVLTDTKAVIAFDTNQLARCLVYYKNQSYASETDSASRVSLYRPDLPVVETDFNTNHSIHLPDLIFSTAYYYTVECFDDLDPATFVYAGEYSFTTLEKRADDAVGDGTGVDTAVPIISNISVANITGESATITWTTHESANSSVAFGLTSGDYNNVASNYTVNSDSANYVTSHSVIVNNIIPSTKYHFITMSLDAAGNISQSSENYFTTKAPSSLSSVRVTFKNLSQAVISWKTEKETTSLVEYGLTTAYGQKNENKTSTKEHEITIAGLEAKQLYHFRVKSTDASGNLFASTDNTFEPKSPPQIDGLKVADVTEHGAKIVFNTDIPTDALITYVDVDDAQNSGSQGKPELSSKHELEIKNLKAGVTYSLKIRVRDEAGNETEETFPSFQTGKDENPPVIDQINTESAIAQNDKIQSIISLLTNEATTSTLVYREGRNGKDVTINVSNKLATKHISVITNFKSGTIYFFRVTARDEAGNETTSGEYAILTPKRSENIIQIIVNNFQEIFKWAK